MTGAGVTEADIARWRQEASDFADDQDCNGMHQHWKATILSLCREVERLNLEVMAHQVGDGYAKGYEHGVLAGMKHEAKP